MSTNELNPDPNCKNCKGTGLYDACCRPHRCSCNDKPRSTDKTAPAATPYTAEGAAKMRVIRLLAIVNTLDERQLADIASEMDKIEATLCEKAERFVKSGQG